MSILSRMILWELVKMFVISLLGITGILLMAGIVAEASQQGLGPAQILAIIPLLIPSTLPYTIPTTTLFATCVVYGRLAADNEILAIKSAGVNLLTVARPAVVLGLAMSVATMSLYYRVIPHTHYLMRSLFIKDVEELLYTMLKRDSRIDLPKQNYAMWVQRVEGRKLMGALFKLRDPDKGVWKIVALAREADLRVDLEKRELRVHMRSVHVCGEGGTQGYFENRVWEVPLPPAFGDERPRRPRDRSWEELHERRDELVELHGLVTEEIAKVTQEMQNPQPPGGTLPLHLANLKERLQTIRLERHAVATEFQMRPALSFGCLCFVLVGCPVGIWLSKSDYLSAFITCFLPIVFVYYPLMLCGSNLAKDGKFDPVFTVWGANAALALWALVSFRQLLKH